MTLRSSEPPRPGAAVDLDALAARTAIEALRAGVPSRTAVAALGLGQPDVEDRFTALLDATADPAEPGGGLLLGGGFGAGKSHALEHLAALAAGRGYAVSRVVVSKETPLHDTAKLLRAGVDTAIPPVADGWRNPGTAITEALAALDPDSPGFTALLRRVTAPTSGLDARFAASLTLTGRLTGPHAGQLRAEVGDAVERFWGGAPLPTPQLRRWLKAAGEPPPQLGAVGVQELARQRLEFLPRLFQAAGWAGWILLIDEVELIGRYPPLSRGRSYAAVADLLTAPRHDPTLALLAVLAFTDDYEAAVLTGKDDRTTIPARLRAQQRPDSEQLAAAATAGMRALTRDLVLLTPPDDEELDRAYSALRDLHGRAFAWTPPHVPGLERLQATRMRQHVRAWINEWDLARLDPTYTPVTLAAPVATQYDEDAELDAPST